MILRRTTLLVLLITFAAVLNFAHAVRAAQTPNVVIIFIDDHGYGDLSCYGSKVNKTPNIDRLADQGVRFTSFYSAYCVCSASRASLLTGSYQPRLNIPGVLGPKAPVGLHPDEVTIADMLETKGYATMCIGKWHLGDSPQTLPTAQGFDHYFGIPYSNDMARDKDWGNNTPDLDKIWKQKKWDIYNNDLMRDTSSIESPVNQVTLTDRYTQEAVKFIEANKSRPFFLYMPHTMVHVPLFVSDGRWVEDPREAFRLAIEHVDWSVGQVLKALEKAGVADNTLVVYTSDNGPWLSKDHHGGSAGPLRNGKTTTYEGGMRVPGIMRWPGHIPAGTVSDEVLGTIDLLPTIAAITGAKLPKHPIDGLDMSALLENPTSPSPRREAGYFYYRNNQPEAVRLGKWKLRMFTEAPRGKRKAANRATAEPTIELYNLDADISESKNLADEHPEIVAKLKALIEKYDAELKSNTRPIWRASN